MINGSDIRQAVWPYLTLPPWCAAVVIFFPSAERARGVKGTGGERARLNQKFAIPPVHSNSTLTQSMVHKKTKQTSAPTNKAIWYNTSESKLNEKHYNSLRFALWGKTSYCLGGISETSGQAMSWGSQLKEPHLNRAVMWSHNSVILALARGGQISFVTWAK